MLFNSLTFLVFLPVVFAIYWGVFRKRKSRHLFLMLASYVFYMSWKPKFLLLLLASTTFDYFTVRAMWRTEEKSVRKLLLIGSLVFNLSILIAFKYADFLLANAQALCGALGWHWAAPHLGWVLPLGISFYTFETVSYAIDGYFRANEPCRSLRDYSLFISFFPHIIAGPIVRPSQFLPQLEREPKLLPENVTLGLSYFLYGLLRKVVVADWLARGVDPVFASPRSFGTAAVWTAVFAYALQIYCDFSGYSLMAIGLAKLFGFDLPFNFKAPYASRSIGEFWRRWHITLSFWFRDYLYMPLVGFAESAWGVLRGLFLTMVLCGLWHGANWTFAAWGLFHGVLLVGHYALTETFGAYWKPLAEAVPRFLREIACRATVFLLVCLGWVLFRAASLGDAAELFSRMFRPTGGQAPVYAGLAAALGAVVLALDVFEYVAESRQLDLERVVTASPALVRAIVYAAALFLMIVWAPTHSRPFIYFQF